MTMFVTSYASKKELKSCIGQTLQYTETNISSIFGEKYRSNGTFIVASGGREFFAQVTMADDKIIKVE